VITGLSDPQALDSAVTGEVTDKDPHDSGTGKHN